MASRFLQPETTRLEISGGDWLLVKKRLTAGEQRRVFSRMVKAMKPGEKVELDPEHVGRSKVIEYLIDWSLVDANNKQVVIRGKSADDVGRILDGLDADSYSEIVKAVDAHETAEDERLEQEKNATAGLSASTPI
jgi:hypothetical protein